MERSECLRKEGNVRFGYYSIADNERTDDDDGDTALTQRKGSRAAPVVSSDGNKVVIQFVAEDPTESTILSGTY